ncbi:hypothetical protein N7466_007531 [Penicillium verhagenii]|uniref:uncharacterized protein n=1 Tax=Penicillium verhagenii TaxID=1562060 RepID=UPI00254564FD|nr:uncharacterized protein N7466_007531 [Penicillium verhagenii]KAJ5928575.1 hypothetical protein N7466_007531 [Penicillium verhagenii]
MPPQPPPQGLNVIALISGGKDSLYSILHCIRNGHKVVALANLHPELRQKSQTPDTDQDEEADIDSFMYQTIGHSVIPLYESALGIPLYRAAITGGALDTSRVYRHDAADQAAESSPSSGSSPAEDETESLVPLLRRVMQAHPEANAVSAGAILSTYQRTRIENIAGRLGLVPLAWLWMYPSLPAPVERDADLLAVREAGLLEDMAAVGCDARIIKVASGGLDDGYLWENVSGSGNAGRALRRRMTRGMGRFAAAEDIKGAVLGEGGEYETLALDGPSFLWKSRIEIEGRDVGSEEGGVGYLKLRGARCVAKGAEDDEGEKKYEPSDVRRPALLDPQFATALKDVSAVSFEAGSAAESVSGTNTVTAPAWSVREPHYYQSTSTWTMANLVAPEAGLDAGDQMRAIADKVQLAMKSFTSDSGTRSTEDIVFATVLLRSMADFAQMNAVYVSLFKKPNPPARVTVACGDSLPSDVKVMVSFVVDMGPRNRRQGLHVQSRSYWAPANIGPYSQAMSIPLQDESRVVYIAGQIPLEPASMEVATEGKSWLEDYRLRAVLALQHLWRIGAEMQVDWWLGGVAFLTGGEHIQTQAQVAWHLWKKVHTRPDNVEPEDSDEEGPQLDAWDIKYGGRAEELTPEEVSTSLPKFSILDAEDELAATVSPFLAVEVDELPRGSDIEWQGLGSRCQQVKLETSRDSVSATTDGGYSYICQEITSDGSLGSLEENLRSAISAHCKSKDLSQVVLYTMQPMAEELWPGQVVPCRSIWGREGRPLKAAVIVQKEQVSS